MKKAKKYYQWYINYKFNWIPQIIKTKLLWKDKFETPRCEHEPSLRIEWLWWGFYYSEGTNKYWEQWLWLNKYKKTKEEWPWINYETKKSSWIEF